MWLQDSAISINVGGERLLVILYNDKAESPMDLRFHPSSGDIKKHVWFGDGYVLAAFRWGFGCVPWSCVDNFIVCWCHVDTLVVCA